METPNPSQGSVTVHAVQITSARNQTSSGEVRIQIWGKQERVRRALKMLGILWGFAIVAVFMPLAHFVLVPGFLIAGPIVAWWISQQQSVVLGGKGICPECKAELPIARAANRWPITDLCTHCRHSVTLTLQ